MRTSVLVLAALFVTLAQPPAPSRGDADAFAPFVAEGAGPADLQAALLEHAATLAAGPDARTAGRVTVASPDEEGRPELAEALDGRLAVCAERLAAAGWTGARSLPPLLVIRVRVRAALPVVIEDGRGHVLVREGRPPSRMPVAPARADGPPVERDVVAAAAATGEWARSTAAAARHGSASLADAVARHAVAAVCPPGAAPPWFREGLATWLSEAGDPDPATPAPTPVPTRVPTPVHWCRPWERPAPAAVAALLGPGEPAAAARPFLARFVGALLTGVGDAPARVERLREGKAGPAAVEAAFGKTVAACAAAAVPTPPVARSGVCGDQGSVPCPVCRGRSRIEIACPDCAGAGNMTCPSCGGSTMCAYCDGGSILRGSSVVRCEACFGTTYHLCRACDGKPKIKCRRCAGGGKTYVACIACVRGLLPCPDAGESVAVPVGAATCAWCAAPKGAPATACGRCLGVGHLGCPTCLGSATFICPWCVGRTAIIANGCSVCNDRHRKKCTDCSGGRRTCPVCTGSGKSAPEPSRCAACRERRSPGPWIGGVSGAPLTTEEAAQAREMLRKATEFLAGCDEGRGFALRDLRRGATTYAGRLWEPTPYSNAEVVWVLAIGGVDPSHPALRRGVETLRTHAAGLVGDGRDVYRGTQAVSQSVRALLATGAKADDPLVLGLVRLLVKGQRGNGLWPADLGDAKDDGDAFSALFAAEALRAARLSGVKVPSAVWQKLAVGAGASLERRDLSVRRKGFVSGTGIVSAAALAVIAKEGSLAKKATAFDYRTLPQVKSALAWLDRHYDPATEPLFADGARLIHGSDGGQSSWLYAVQRLAQLLSLEQIGGGSWHASGVRTLLPLQYGDGSFEERSRDALNGPVRTTSACILFLVRATPAVTDAGDE